MLHPRASAQIRGKYLVRPGCVVFSVSLRLRLRSGPTACGVGLIVPLTQALSLSSLRAPQERTWANFLPGLRP